MNLCLQARVHAAFESMERKKQVHFCLSHEVSTVARALADHSQHSCSCSPQKAAGVGARIKRPGKLDGSVVDLDRLAQLPIFLQETPEELERVGKHLRTRFRARLNVRLKQLD
eukprot:Amastigsp_a2876_30.p3 type:complete len:113 gc:universal Amastigsp_a2876_30:228-566(+)